MTQPYYPQQPMQQPQYQQPPQQPQYQQPMMPQYPVQQGYPQQPQFVQPPPVPLVQGTLSDFFNQPSTGGGPVFSWKGKPIGTTYGGIVNRQITNADIQQQSTPGTNQPAYYRDGRPKYLMKVPLTVQQSPEFPDGQAQWWVSGSARDELARAMAEAGCDSNSVPEAGAVIVVTLTGERPSGPGMNPSKTYRVQYQRPQGALPAGVPVHGQALATDINRQMTQQQPTTQANGAASVQVQQPQTMSAVTAQPPTMQQPMPQQQQVPVPASVQPQQTVHVPAQQVQAMQQPAPVQQAPSDLNAAQAELLQTLIAQQQQ